MCTCDRALMLINEKIDQCISHENDSVLRSHLSECDECRGIYDAYSLIQQDLLALEVEAPENFAGQVMFRVMGEQQKKKRKIPARLIGTVACAAVLALAIGFTDITDFLSPKMESAVMSNTSTSMNDSAMMERATDTATSDTYSFDAEEDGGDMLALDEGVAPEEEADASQMEAPAAKGKPAELSDYAIVLVYENLAALGDYAMELEFAEGPLGTCCMVTIEQAEEIYAARSNVVSYEIYTHAYAANADAIILIQE